MNKILSTTNSEDENLIAALYARVSTGRQEQEETIESQVSEIKSEVESRGYYLPEENIFVDDGWPGEILERPDLDGMRDSAQDGKFQILFVYDRGRLSRDFVHQEIVIRELFSNEISFESLHDVEAKDDTGRLMQSVMGIFHEYERVKIAERMRRGKLYKAKKGILINGHAKYGWKYIPKTEKTDPKLVVDEREALVVRKIWNWFGNENLSINEIRRKLYGEKIYPKKNKSKYWAKTQIIRLLQCESYVSGVVYYNKTEAVAPKNPIKKTKYRKIKKSSRRVRPKEDWIPYQVEPLIDDHSLYHRIMKRLNLNQKYARKNRKYDYLLTEKLYCECGLPRSGDGSNKNGHYYYRCSERVRKLSKENRKCFAKGVNAQVLDKVFWDELVKLLSDSSLLKKYAREWLKRGSKKSRYDDELNGVGKIIKDIDAQKDRYAKAYGEGLLEFEQFSTLASELKNKKTSMKKHFKSLEKKISDSQIEVDIDELCVEAVKVMKNLDLNNKKQVVRDIIDRIVVKERRRVEVWINIPLPVLSEDKPLKLGYEPISWNSWFA